MEGSKSMGNKGTCKNFLTSSSAAVFRPPEMPPKVKEATKMKRHGEGLAVGHEEGIRKKRRTVNL